MSFRDALITCVDAAGGPKHVGHALWPHMDPIEAGKKLCRCLDRERPEKLAPEEVWQVLRLAREYGCHVGIEYLADTLGYSRPVLAAPIAEEQALLRQMVALGKRLAATAERMEQRGVVLQFKALVGRFKRLA